MLVSFYYSNFCIDACELSFYYFKDLSYIYFLKIYYFNEVMLSTDFENLIYDYLIVSSRSLILCLACSNSAALFCG